MRVIKLIQATIPRNLLPRLQNAQLNAASISVLPSLNSTFIPLLERLGNWVDDVKESILKAVPKKKTSYAKKRMRASGKGLKNLKNIVSCYSCGSPKLMHQLCPNCYKEFRGRIRESNNGTNIEV